MTNRCVLTFSARVSQYVKTWTARGYANGIPDEADANLEALNKVPSYRRLCMAILSNDWHMQTLGGRRPLCEAYMDLKRIEIEARNECLRSQPSPS
jgi:predicted phosphoadenosine phosphosulfate sulfurtransferase